MRIISQNIINYGFDVPTDIILRINLAWCNSIEELKNILKKHKESKIFLDLPIKRIKPPNNKYSLDDLIPVLSSYTQIKYFAISNVESASDIESILEKIPENVILVPKIESSIAVDNIAEITNVLPYSEKIVMLDHDDIFSKLLEDKRPTEDFKKIIKNLTDYCNSNNITLLRVIGVIFSDEEKRISDYIN